MRFIHTSDWHLGQYLHQFDRSHEHQCFLDWLLASLQQEQADALLIAGDVFDNANPSASSQRQFYHFLQQARQALPNLDIIVTAGNHDSPGRLEAPGPLLHAMGVQVVGTVPRNADGAIDFSRLVLPLRNHAGEVAAWCLALPFLRPGDVPRVEQASDDTDLYMQGVAMLYQQALEHALSLREDGQAILAIGHCHMTGGSASPDSERRIVIGGSEALPASAFDPAIAYIALGHLHLAQRVGGREHVRYSGSPLPMSFAELDYPHQVLRVDLEGGDVNAITPLHVPRAVELLRVPPKPAPLAEVLDALAALELEAAAPERQPYLEVRVWLDAPEPGLRTRLEQALEGKPVRLVKIERSTTVQSTGPAAASLDELEQLQPEAIFERLCLARYGAEPAPELRSALGELLLEAGRAA